MVRDAARMRIAAALAELDRLPSGNRLADMCECGYRHGRGRPCLVPRVLPPGECSDGYGHPWKTDLNDCSRATRKQAARSQEAATARREARERSAARGARKGREARYESKSATRMRPGPRLPGEG